MLPSRLLMLAAILLCLAGCSANVTHKAQTSGEDAVLLTPAADDADTGLWRAGRDALDPGTDYCRLAIAGPGDEARHLATLSQKRIEQTADGYRLMSAVGTLTLRLDPGRDEAGTYMLAARPDLAARYPRITGQPSRDDLLKLIVGGVDEAYIDAIAADGYAPSSWSQVARLHGAGVSPAFIGDIRRARSTPPAAPPALATLPEPGPLPQFTTDDIIKLSSYNVPAEFVKQMQAAGYRLDAQQLIKLRSYNVPAEYAAALREAGFDYTVENLIKLRSYNVPAAYAVELRKAGFDFSIEQMIKLRSYNVPNAYIIALHAAGYRFSIEETIKLRSYNVSQEYALAMLESQHEPLTVEQLIRLKSYNVDPELVAALRDQTVEPR